MIEIKTKFISVLRIIIFCKIIYYNNMLECTDRNTPFERNEVCVDTCAINETTSGTCEIKNEIIKNQWLNNIIYFAPGGYRYINIAVTGTNNLYAITSGNFATNQRYLYILNREGIGWFNGNDGNKTPFTITSVTDSETKGRYESTSFIIKFYNPTYSYQDYLMSISKDDQNVEIYDFYAGIIDVKKVASAFGSLNNVFSYVAAHVKLSNSENLNVYLIGLLATENNIDYFYLKKVKFDESYTAEIIKETKVESFSGSKIVSCFETTASFIVCFYRNKEKKHIMIVYNQDLEQKANLCLDDGNSNDEIFLKCVHFSNEAGAFAYFTNDNQPLLKIQFKKYGSNQITDYCQSVPYLVLNNYNLNTFMTLSDIVKVSNKKIYYVGTSNDKKILYIISIFNYHEEKFMTRIYSVNMYNFHNNYNFYKEIGIVLYNDMLAMASSFLYGSDQTPYSSIIIFSYPNTTDVEFEISNYLFKNNDIKIYNLSIGINGEFIMENNIFGYTYSGIEFIEDKCSGLNDIYFTTENNEAIVPFYFLEKNKTIKLVIPKSDNYNTFTCKFRYACIVSEPEYSEFNKYPEKINFTGHVNDEDLYFNSQKTNYKGKYSYYSLYLDKQLTEKDCGENCELCSSDKSKCYTCKYSFNIMENKKVCENESLLISSEVQITEAQTSEIQTTDAQTIEVRTTESQIIETQTIEAQTIEAPTTETQTKETQTIEAQTKEAPTTETRTIEAQTSETQITEAQTTETHTKETQIAEIQITETHTTVIEKTNKINESEMLTDEKIYEKCNIEEIKGNNCTWEISNEQVEEIYTFIKDNLIKKNETIIIKTRNTIFEKSTTNEQKNINNANISNIDLGQCEDELKYKNNISESQSLIIFKIDFKSIDKKKTYVEYEVYHPSTHNQLNMSICQNLTIDIYTPVSLSQSDSLLFHSLNTSGYNLYNPKDPFYNEICTPYTTINGTDILLSDRKVDIYSKSGNEALCQIGCKLLSYDENNKKAKCNCKIKAKEGNPSLIDGLKFDKKEIEESFFDTLSNSNFLVLKCYKLAFDLEKLFENKGRIMMSIFFILFIILLIVFCFTGNKKLNYYLEKIIKEKLMNKHNNKQSNKLSTRNNGKQKGKLKKDKTMMKKNKSKSKKQKKGNSNKKDNYKNDVRNKNKNKKEDNNKKNKKSKKGKKEKLFPPKKKTNHKAKFENSLGHSTGTAQNIIISINNHYNNEKMNKKIFHKNKLINKQNTILKNSKDSLIIHKTQYIKQTEKDFDNSSDLKKKKELTEFEMNSLNYELALIIDKRTYWQYYWSLLKQKHLILFTFLPVNDFNLSSLKIALFILSFSLYFTINGFFFKDETMHKVYKDNGELNIIYQIPQILYSSLVSSVINMILKALSLSQKNILEIKHEKDKKYIMKKSKRIKNCIQIKFVIFFILSFFLLLFFWYFISCFCGVYKNTQIILIKDTLISFGLSMIYPIGINLLPGIFRIPSLRAKKRDKKFMYKISGLIALI